MIGRLLLRGKQDEKSASIEMTKIKGIEEHGIKRYWNLNERHGWYTSSAWVATHDVNVSSFMRPMRVV